MMDRTSSRSSKYQRLFNEILIKDWQLSNFSEADSLYGENQEEDKKEQLLLKKKYLVDCVISLAQTLSERNRTIFLLWFKGESQVEIAQKLNLTQGSINKSLYGAYIYKNGKRIRQTPGSFKKLKKLFFAEPELQKIFDEYMELKED